MSLTRLESGRSVPTHVPPPDRGRTVDWRRLRSPVAAWALLACAVAAVGTSLGSLFAGRLAEQATAQLVGWLAALRRRSGPPRHRRAHVVGRGRRPRRGPAARGPARRCAAPAAAGADGAGGGRGPRPGRRRHPRGRHAAAPERLAGDPHPARRPGRCGSWPGSPGGRRSSCSPVAGVGRTGRRPPAAARDLAPARSSRRRRGPTTPPPWRRASPGATTCGRASARPTCCAGGAPSSPPRCTPGSPTSSRLESRIGRRTGTLLHAVLAATARRRRHARRRRPPRTASLVTLFLVTTMFVGQIDQLARHLPDLQAGFGAVLRLRGLLGARPRARRRRGAARRAARRGVPRPALRLRRGTVRAAARRPARRRRAPPCALVGRTGSGKSTLASLLSRAVEPERGSVLLGGVDVPDLDLQRLRSAVGVVTQRTEILAGTLAENITLFERRAPRRRRARGRRARPRRLGRRASRRASTPLLGPGGTTCLRARSSWSRSRACWCATSGSSCSTRPPPAWTRSPRPTWCARPTACLPDAPASWSPTGSRRPSARSRSRCSTAGASCSTVRGRRLAAKPGPFRVAAGDGGRRTPPHRARKPRPRAPSGSGRLAAPGGRPPGVGWTTSRAWPGRPCRRCSSSPGGVWSASGSSSGLALSGAFGALTGWIWGHLVVALQDGGAARRC